MSTEAYNWLSKHLDGHRRMYPTVVDGASLVLEALLELASPDAEELFSSIVSLVDMNRADNVAVLVLRASDVSSTQSLLDLVLEPQKGIVINPTALRHSSCYDCLITVGPPSWFPEFVFVSPRSMQTHIVNYQWLDNSWGELVTFSHPVRLFRRRRQFHDDSPDIELNADIGLDVSLPEINFDEVARWISLDAEDTETSELVEARICYLEAAYVTLLESHPDSRVTIIDLEENDENQFRQAKTKYLEPGMFIILRTEGGGDYIVPVANRIMGNQSAHLRNLQANWKKRLAREVDTRGLDPTVEALIDLGSERASPQNVANWIRARSIKTRDPEDFKAILCLVGLGEDFEEYWTAMARIVEAHRKAGHYIRQLLLKKARESDLSELNRRGVMTIELGDSDAGSLTAFRILSISDSTLMVPPWRIGEALKTGVNSWL